jgi:hypothetical protein
MTTRPSGRSAARGEEVLGRLAALSQTFGLQLVQDHAVEVGRPLPAVDRPA